MAKLKVDLPNLIRQTAVGLMQEIMLFHVHIMLLLLSVQLLFHASSCMTMIPLITLAVFCNTVCLAERIWDIQLRTMSYWPIATQGVFMVSRLMVVTAAILTVVVFIRAGTIGLKSWIG